MRGVNDIRSAFLDFFAKNSHTVLPSSPLVPRNDPSLMFTNAGMVQFKTLFTGVEKRPYTRAVTSQKCVRAGGKHNDLDNVGYTARHHTFFEMLGNFSFGDYFKEEAIYLAWTLISKEFSLPKDKLSVTVYHDDDEAFELWRKIAGLPEERIIRIATADNFWSMGDTGPCGPCSEIFYDHGEHIPGGPPGSPDADGDRFIEIWNLVFMQFEQLSGGERINLPKPSIDTGMGLERVSAVLQGTHDNYQTDMMRALIAAVADLSGISSDGHQGASHRVIADHLRASSFLVADGVLPSNEGRGYVVRRIMRRAMRHAQLLGMREPLLYRLVSTLVHEMGAAFPELLRAQALITEALQLEESRFRQTLDRGLSLLEGEVRTLREGELLSGDVAFKLYDTYGFPLDLTQDALRVRKIGVDLTGFNAAMSRQKSEARASWSGSGEAESEAVWFGIRDSVGASDFLGYDAEMVEAEVLAIIADGKQIDFLKAGEKGALIFNQTCFYGESGGQVGDSGEIFGSDFRFQVTDTQKRVGDLFVHFGIMLEGSLKIGLPAVLRVDSKRRAAIRVNHSATHLLHESLRHVLGDHVAQKGSLVDENRLRFDISHNKPISIGELEAVEDVANAIILRNEPITTRLMSVDDAIASGARALFGEKYGDEVRVVSMGSVETLDSPARSFSVELCGGIHASRTGDIGLIAILGEGPVSAGVRRIEALTGTAARRYLSQRDRKLRDIAAALKVSIDDVPERVQLIAEERRKLEKDLGEARRQLAFGKGRTGGGEGTPPSEFVELAGTRFLGRKIEGVSVRDLKPLAEQQAQLLGSGIVALAVVGDDGRTGLVVALTPDMIQRYDAVSLVRVGSEILGGKGGGGRADMAQGGGPDGHNVDAAFAAIASQISALG